MQEPRRVRIPKTIRFWGITAKVTAVTSIPAPKTVIPRRKCRFPRGQQKPDSRIKVQQMLLCHRNMPEDLMSIPDTPSRWTISHTR